MAKQDKNQQNGYGLKELVASLQKEYTDDAEDITRPYAQDYQHCHAKGAIF